MEKMIATFKDYAIFMADKTRLLEIAQFVVRENYSHHLFYDEKKGCFTNRPQKEFCEFRQEYIKKILTLLVVIRTDEPLWRLLINSLNGKEL